MPEISIIMLVHNQLDVTRDAIKALRRWSRNYELIVFDNGSDPETEQYLKRTQSQFPDLIKLIRSNTNIGFIKGCNESAKVAKGDFICCLNNDVLISGPWIDAMLDVLKRDPTIAQVGAKRLPSHWFMTGSARSDWYYVEGWCFTIPRCIYEKFGLFDEVNLEFAYCEDADLSYRLLEAGYKLAEVHMPITHARSLTRAALSSKIDFIGMHNRNKEYMEKRWK